MSLTDELLAKLQGAPLQQVSQQLGISDTQASGAISAALPVLMGALGNNASQPQGAQALLGALQNNHRGLDPVSNTQNTQHKKNQKSRSRCSTNQ